MNSNKPFNKQQSQSYTSTWYIYDHKVSWLTCIHVGMQCERTSSSASISTFVSVFWDYFGFIFTTYT